MTYQSPDSASQRKTINPPLAIAIAVVVILAIVTTIVVLTAKDDEPGPTASDPSVQTTTAAATSGAPTSDAEPESSAPPAGGDTYENGYPISETDGEGEFPGDEKGSPPGWKRMSATGLGLSFDFPEDWDVPSEISFGADAGSAAEDNGKSLLFFGGVSGGSCDTGGSVAFAGFQYLETDDPVAGLADVLARYGPVAWPNGGQKSGKAAAGVAKTTKGGAEGFTSSVKVILSKGDCATTEALATGFSVVSDTTGETFVFLGAVRRDGDLGNDAPNEQDIEDMLESIRQLDT